MGRKREEDGGIEEGARWREREAVWWGMEGPDGGKRGEGMGWGRRDQGRGRAKYVCVCGGGGSTSKIECWE